MHRTATVSYGDMAQRRRAAAGGGRNEVPWRTAATLRGGGSLDRSVPMPYDMKASFLAVLPWATARTWRPDVRTAAALAARTMLRFGGPTGSKTARRHHTASMSYGAMAPIRTGTEPPRTRRTGQSRLPVSRPPSPVPPLRRGRGHRPHRIEASSQGRVPHPASAASRAASLDTAAPATNHAPPTDHGCASNRLILMTVLNPHVKISLTRGHAPRLRTFRSGYDKPGNRPGGNVVQPIQQLRRWNRPRHPPAPK
jgi:hypothetical protein